MFKPHLVNLSHTIGFSHNYPPQLTQGLEEVGVGIRPAAERRILRTLHATEAKPAVSLSNWASRRWSPGGRHGSTHHRQIAGNRIYSINRIT